MLTVEEIKKCIEEFKPSNIGYSEEGSANKYQFYIKHYEKEYLYNSVTIYELFLQKIIEAINRHFSMNEKGFFISQDITGLEVCRWRGVDIKFFPLDYYGIIIKAKEQTIKYILERI